MEDEMDELETKWNTWFQIVEKSSHTLKENKAFFYHTYMLKDTDYLNFFERSWN